MNADFGAMATAPLSGFRNTDNSTGSAS